MFLKQKIHTAEGSITAGLIFFLIAIVATQVADNRLLGGLITELIAEESLVHTIQGFADGFALPMLFASIFFNLHGFTIQRSQK